MKLKFLAGAAAVMACATVTYSQDTPTSPVTQLEPVTLVAEKTEEPDHALTVPAIPEIRADLQRRPGGVDVIDAEVFLKGRSSTLKDVLQWSPGVFVQERFGAEEARLSIRGSGLQRTFHGRGLTLLQDGVPVNLADGGFDFQVIDPFSVRHVEVYRGSTALEYGSSTLGGAINYVSPTGYDAERIKVRGEAGSYGYLRGQIASGYVLGPVDYYASVTHFSQDGYQDHGLQQNEKLFANIGYRITEGLETRLYVTAVETDSELPGSLTKAQLYANPRQASPGNLAGNYQRNYELLRVADKTTWTTDNGQLDVSTWWAYKDLYHPIPMVFDQLSNDIGINARYVCTGDLMGRENRFILGFRPTYGRLEDNRFGNTGGVATAPILSRTTQALNFEAYAQEEYQVADRFLLVAGVQFVHANRRSERTAPATSLALAEQSYDGVNPRLGLTYDVTDDAQIYGNISRSYEPPSFGELSPFLFFAAPGAAEEARLEAQSATTVELGTRGAKGRFNWDVTLYHAWVDDELLGLNTAAGTPLGTINATATRHLGVELFLNTKLWEGIATDTDTLSLKQLYNWSHFVFDSDPVYGHNQLAGFPPHLYRAELMYEHPCGVYAGPNLEWVPSRYAVDHANSFFADSYATFGFKTGWRSDRGFGVFFEARNLADKTYAATTGVVADALGADTANFNPGVGRAFYGGIEWTW